jgi:hypothetical protein
MARHSEGGEVYRALPRAVIFCHPLSYTGAEMLLLNINYIHYYI